MAELNGSSAASRKEAAAPERPRGSLASSKSARSRVAAGVDPLARVLATGPRLPLSVVVVLAILLHVGMAAGASAASLFDAFAAFQKLVRSSVDMRLAQYELDVAKEPPPPEPEPEKPPEPEAKAEPEPEKPAPKAENPPPAAPPQPAEAAKIMAAEPTPNEGPVDLTNSFVTGSGSTFAGGTTSSDGTSKKAVYNPAAASTGVPGGTGTVPAPAAPPRVGDKSRAPGLLGSVDWNDCPFPGEADAEQVDQAYVMIQVKVKPDGSPENVTIVQDPGKGFGREARKCAMRKKYANGLDADGNAIGGMTKPFRVRFER